MLRDASLHRLLSTLSDPALTIRGGGAGAPARVLYANRAFEGAFGLPADWLAGKGLDELAGLDSLSWLLRCDTAVSRNAEDAFNHYEGAARRSLGVSLLSLEDGSFCCTVKVRGDSCEDESGDPAALDGPLLSLLDATDDLILTADLQGRIRRCYGSWFRRNHGGPCGLLGEDVYRVFGYENEHHLETALYQAIADGLYSVDLRIPSEESDGYSEVEFTFTYLDSIGFLAIGRDITERVAEKRRLKTLAERNEYLVQELLHRVKNNLQVSISLIELESWAPDFGDAKDFARTLVSRLHALGVVQDEFVATMDERSLSVSNIAQKVLQHYKASGEGWAPELRDEAGSTRMDIDNAIPFGLLLNEFFRLLGRRSESAARGWVRLGAASGAGLCLSADLTPAEFDMQGEDPSSVIIRGLAAQLKGTLETDSCGLKLRLSLVPHLLRGNALIEAEAAS